jgi:hypothetical protein
MVVLDGSEEARSASRSNSLDGRSGTTAVAESVNPTRDESSDSMPYESKHLALASLDHLPDGAAVCHWDFHPGNVIETTDGSKVVNWSNVRRGAALADVARTLLIIRAGALPPGTPFLVRKLIGFGRSVLGCRYLHEYRRLRPFHDRDLQPWKLVSPSLGLDACVRQFGCSGATVCRSR